MVNRGKSGVRVSVSVFVAGWGGFWRAVVWQGHSGGWGVCCCSCGSGQSPVQAALSSTGWEKNHGSSTIIKSSVLLFSWLSCSHCWLWESALWTLMVVCAVNVGLWHLVLYSAPLLWCSVASKLTVRVQQLQLPGTTELTQEVQWS